ncbi:MAG: hypothetical protein AB7V24_10280 [Steroidobacteraceae bacterium]
MTGGLMFRWSGIDNEMTVQLAYQEQFLRFFRHLLENLQHSSVENPAWASMPLSLSLRAGAIKAYVQCVVSILEGALAAAGARVGLPGANNFHRMAYGQLLGAWARDNQPRPEVAAIWDDLQLLKKCRNFIHLGNAAANDDAYWQSIVESEQDLLQAADRAIAHVSALCTQQNGG